MVGISVLPAWLHARANAVAQPVIESSIDDKRAARNPIQKNSKGIDSESDSGMEITDGGMSSKEVECKGFGWVAKVVVCLNAGATISFW